MKTPVIACDKREAFAQGEAKQSILSFAAGWICFARNDGCALVHACGRECEGNGGGGRSGVLGSRQAPADRPAIIQ
jgi:hypothetical protein